jgi:hypothetical protein
MRGQRGSVVQKGNSYFIKYRGPDSKQKMAGSRPGHGFKTYEEAQARLHESHVAANTSNVIFFGSTKSPLLISFRTSKSASVFVDRRHRPTAQSPDSN